MGFLRQKRLDVYKTVCAKGNSWKFASRVKNVRKTTTLQNILKIRRKACVEKGGATINLPKLVCVVINIQGTSICCFRSDFCKTAYASGLLLQITLRKPHCANHNAQLSFRLKFAPIVKNLNLVTRNC